eukprot:UN33974
MGLLKKRELKAHLSQFHINETLFDDMWSKINCEDDKDRPGFQEGDFDHIDYNEFQSFLETLDDNDTIYEKMMSWVFLGAFINFIGRVIAMVIFFTADPEPKQYELKLTMNLCLFAGASVVLWFVFKIIRQDARLNQQTLFMLTHVNPKQTQRAGRPKFKADPTKGGEAPISISDYQKLVDQVEHLQKIINHYHPTGSPVVQVKGPKQAVIHVTQGPIETSNQIEPDVAIRNHQNNVEINVKTEQAMKYGDFEGIELTPTRPTRIRNT